MDNGTRLTFDIFARDHASDKFNKFGKVVNKSGQETERTSKKMKSAARAVGGLAGAYAALGAGQKAIDFMKSAVAEARESEKVNKLTAQTIKTTGGAAKVTATEIGSLATAISNKTAVDDEAVQSGSNLLLTFKNVRNEAGKGNKIFARATAAAVDLSASGFGSISSSSKMLGKALNDPLKGISALSRAGVTFTDSQKAQIAALVEAGDTAKAQALIMKEVESQVGGSAAAQATSAEKLTTSWSNFKEEIGTGMLPMLDDLANKGIQVTNWARANPTAVYGLAVAFGVLAVAFIALTSPVTLIIGALAALAAGFAYLYTKNKAFADGVNAVWKNVLQPVFRLWVFYITKILFPVIRMLWTKVYYPIFKKVGSFALETWETKIKPAFEKIKNGIRVLKIAFKVAKDGIVSVWSGLTAAIKAPLVAAMKALNKFFAGIDKIAKFFGKSFKFRFDVGGGNGAGGGGTGGGRQVKGGIGRPVSRSGGQGGKGKTGGRTWPANTRALSNNYAGHSGVDIAAASGSPIRAAASGRIQYTGWGRGYGQAIFQSLPGGGSAVYGHTSQVGVKAGQSVRSGQTIGRVGSTGRSTGPHLHFEVNGAGPFGSPANRAATLAWLGGAKVKSGAGSPPSVPGLVLPGWLGGIGGKLRGMAKDWVAGGVFDTGGMLPSGQAALNLSGRPERVLNPVETESLTAENIARAVTRGLSGATFKMQRDGNLRLMTLGG